MSNQENENNKEQKGYFNFSEVFAYYFRKKDPSKKADINLRMMHGVNKIAIILFLLAISIWIIRRVF